MSKKKVAKKSTRTTTAKKPVKTTSLTHLSLITISTLAALLIVLNFLAKKPEIMPTTLPQSASSLTSPKSTTYAGTFPCADCPGIKTEITLNKDSSFRMTEIYLERNDEEPIITNGTWEIIEDKNTKKGEIMYKLTVTNGQSGPFYYLLTPNGNQLLSVDNSTMLPLTAEGLNFTLTKK